MYCNERFDPFRSAVLAYVYKHGFKNASCSMELKPNSKEAVVNFSAYVCVDWDQWRDAEHARGRCLRSQWTFDGCTPLVHFSIIRHNSCPKNVLSESLFYCYVPKIGTVFQFCTLTPGKDCSYTAGLPAPTRSCLTSLTCNRGDAELWLAVGCQSGCCECCVGVWHRPCLARHGIVRCHFCRGNCQAAPSRLR